MTQQIDIIANHTLNDLEKGGKKAQIGEIRPFGSRNYIKTAEGWKYHGKGTGKKAQAHKAGTKKAAHYDDVKKVLSLKKIDYSKLSDEEMTSKLQELQVLGADASSKNNNPAARMYADLYRDAKKELDGRKKEDSSSETKKMPFEVKVGDKVHHRPEKRKTTTIGIVTQVSPEKNEIVYRAKNGEEYSTNYQQIRAVNGVSTESKKTVPSQITNAPIGAYIAVGENISSVWKKTSRDSWTNDDTGTKISNEKISKMMEQMPDFSITDKEGVQSHRDANQAKAEISSKKIKKSEDSDIIIQYELNNLEKGKAAQEGEERTWGGRTYVKTGGKWIEKTKGRGKGKDDEPKGKSAKKEDSSSKKGGEKKEESSSKESTSNGEVKKKGRLLPKYKSALKNVKSIFDSGDSAKLVAAIDELPEELHSAIPEEVWDLYHTHDEEESETPDADDWKEATASTDGGATEFQTVDEVEESWTKAKNEAAEELGISPDDQDEWDENEDDINRRAEELFLEDHGNEYYDAIDEAEMLEEEGAYDYNKFADEVSDRIEKEGIGAWTQDEDNIAVFFKDGRMEMVWKEKTDETKYSRVLESVKATGQEDYKVEAKKPKKNKKKVSNPKLDEWNSMKDKLGSEKSEWLRNLDKTELKALYVDKFGTDAEVPPSPNGQLQHLIDDKPWVDYEGGMKRKDFEELDEHFEMMIEEGLSEEFNMEDFMSEHPNIKEEDLMTALYNLEDEDVMRDIAQGNYSSFDLDDSSQFNDGYEDMMEDFDDGGVFYRNPDHYDSKDDMMVALKDGGDTDDVFDALNSHFDTEFSEEDIPELGDPDFRSQLSFDEIEGLVEIAKQNPK